MKKDRITLFIGLLVGLTTVMFYVGSCKEELTIKPFYEEKTESMTDYMEARPDSFSHFFRLVQTAGMEKTLTAYNPGGNNYTLFLPTDEALEQFVQSSNTYDNLDDLLNDEEYVNLLVRYHVVNIELESNEFPFGSLPDTTLTGDLLTIGFVGELDSVILKVNNRASIIKPNIEVINGTIHQIDLVLRPIVFSSYEWLSENPDYSIFSEALEVTGLNNVFRINTGAEGAFYPPNTVLAEPDKIFNKNNIYNIDDLKNRYSPDNQNYSDPSNLLFQFMAYHILEGKHFLNSFEGVNTNYNTYGNLPIYLNGRGLDIKINSGVEVFDTLISGGDTTIIDYVGLDYENSNVTTKNGAIHTLSNIMNLFSPPRSPRIFQFYEEPLIFEAEKSPNTYDFDLQDREAFRFLNWYGVEELMYVKSGSDLTGVWNNDYIQVEGDFSISYEIPRILPGRYNFQIRADAVYHQNATIQVFLDGRKIGSNIDLTQNPGGGTSSMNSYNVGIVDFSNYESHEIVIQS